MLILREQIAPFDVDFTVRELSLDFSNMRTAAYGLLSKSTRLFALNSNNSLLEFLLEVSNSVAWCSLVLQCFPISLRRYFLEHPSSIYPPDKDIKIMCRYIPSRYAGRSPCPCPSQPFNKVGGVRVAVEMSIQFLKLMQLLIGKYLGAPRSC